MEGWIHSFRLTQSMHIEVGYLDKSGELAFTDSNSLKRYKSTVAAKGSVRVLTDLSSWQQDDSAEYRQRFGLSGPPDLHKVYTFDYAGISFFVPAIVIVESFFKPFRLTVPAFFGPRAFEALSSPVVDGDKFVGVQCSKNLDLAHGRSPALGDFYKWLWSYPSAGAFAHSIYQHALAGSMNVTLPIGVMNALMIGRSIRSRFYVTSLQPTWLSTLETPYPYAADADRLVRLQRSSLRGFEGDAARSVLKTDPRPPSDEEWALVKHTFEKTTRPHRMDMRILVNAVCEKTRLEKRWTEFKFEGYTGRYLSKVFSSLMCNGRWQRYASVLERVRQLRGDVPPVVLQPAKWTGLQANGRLAPDDALSSARWPLRWPRAVGKPENGVVTAHLSTGLLPVDPAEYFNYLDLKGWTAEDRVLRAHQHGTTFLVPESLMRMAFLGARPKHRVRLLSEGILHSKYQTEVKEQTVQKVTFKKGWGGFAPPDVQTMVTWMTAYPSAGLLHDTLNPKSAVPLALPNATAVFACKGLEFGNVFLVTEMTLNAICPTEEPSLELCACPRIFEFRPGKYSHHISAIGNSRADRRFLRSDGTWHVTDEEWRRIQARFPEIKNHYRYGIAGYIACRATDTKIEDFKARPVPPGSSNWDAVRQVMRLCGIWHPLLDFVREMRAETLV